ncbi:general secretion pathway protein GspB [Thalassotalea aquiviva]|uniref:general secretion pathway protein GspB n=1 Tax=Thalassotalea aquiviva TaxID=3242415 RepID=UPI00352A3BB0
MSYILDALKKSQQPLTSIDFISDNLDRVEDSETLNVIKKSVATVAVIVACFSAGFLLSGGKQVIHYAQKPMSEYELPVLEIQTQDEPLKWPSFSKEYQENVYFDQPERFNQLNTSRQQAYWLGEIERQEQLQKAEKQAQQQAVAEQVKRVIEQQGALVAATQVTEQVLEQTTAQYPNQTQAANRDIHFNADDLEGVSPELLQAFEQALSEEQAQSSTASSLNNTPLEPERPVKMAQEEIKPLAQMPQWLQDAVPPLHFSMHMYSSIAEQSWLRLNRKDYYAGAMTDEGLVIEKILPQEVILQYQGQRFSLKALSSW